MISKPLPFWIEKTTSMSSNRMLPHSGSRSKEVSAPDALQKAEQFVRLHPEFHQYRLSKIVDDKGVSLGYEIRPMYFPAAYGVSDVIDICYTMKDGKVSVFCSLTPSGEKIQNQQSGG